ncbi:putative protein serine/threonine kinase [Heterostelium album PN500]|uniref:non-specific serine/threonine protein kinase n=1 Tax=Heterostelium pallidum (strain ATCC 26659 / Pp 5 / PN500) TaxID=670386 RepID=D3B5R9_HETP5|nr:putative protein serine/threonine kinase [Heterostelium album PN500]EFA83217.1 putative protein serine/threonine kinase [Heterostelium album PN500]|eukprot:XP_020435334.1 putative protein serine/threonine kinase [Heterostelium album PN500]
MEIHSVGPFIIGKTLGQGTTGKVKLGFHKDTGFKVGIKIINKDLLNNKPSMRRKIEREVVLMKLIDHPNALKMYEVYETSNYLYVKDKIKLTILNYDRFLILEYVEGGELFDYLVEKGGLESGEALFFFQQIIGGLDYCHSRNICHRDLKPENLLLSGDKKIKICDFGMGSIIKKDSLLHTSCGSPHYASPEVVSGIDYDGQKTDVWSCGVILYALLTGRLPFDDDNIRRLLSKVKSGDFVMPAYIHKDAQDLLTKMLIVDPKKRISIKDIKKHPWFLSNTVQIQKSIPVDEIVSTPLPDLSVLDDEIFRSLMVLGLGSVDEVKKALVSNEKSQILVYYRLLEERKKYDTEGNKYGVKIAKSASGNDKRRNSASELSLRRMFGKQKSATDINPPSPHHPNGIPPPLNLSNSNNSISQQQPSQQQPSSQQQQQSPRQQISSSEGLLKQALQQHHHQQQQHHQQYHQQQQQQQQQNTYGSSPLSISGSSSNNLKSQSSSSMMNGGANGATTTTTTTTSSGGAPATPTLLESLNWNQLLLKPRFMVLYNRQAELEQYFIGRYKEKNKNKIVFTYDYEIQDTMFTAIDCNNRQILKFLIDHLEQKVDLSSMLTRSATRGRMDIVNYLMTLPYNNWNYKFALLQSPYGKNFQVFEFLVGKVQKSFKKGDRPLSEIFGMTIIAAAKSGRTDMIQWLLDRFSLDLNTIIDRKAIYNILMGGHVHIAEWLKSRNIDIFRLGGLLTMNYPATQRRFEMMKWLHKNNIDNIDIGWTGTMDYIAMLGDLEILQWMHENRSEGCSSKAIDNAASRGYLSVVIWLHENTDKGCTTDAMDGACFHSFELVRWLHENRSEGCTLKAFENAVRSNKLEILDFLMQNRTEFLSENLTNHQNEAMRKKIDLALDFGGHVEIINFFYHNYKYGIHEIKEHILKTIKSCYQPLLSFLLQHHIELFKNNSITFSSLEVILKQCQSLTQSMSDTTQINNDKMDNKQVVINFYRAGDSFGCFSNFSRHKVHLAGFVWPTSEHYFQVYHYRSVIVFYSTAFINLKVLFDSSLGYINYYHAIREAKTPGDSASMGRSRAHPLRKDWEDIKDKVMFDVCLAKFQQHKDIQKHNLYFFLTKQSVLLDTEDATLVEHTKNDSYWGDGGDGTGKNMLGQTLEKVRDFIRNNPK